MTTIQQKLEVVRPPRVKIRYDVHTAGAIVVKELPYVLGIMSDLSCQSEVAKAPFRDRKFIDVRPDTLTDIMESIRPKAKFNVPNRFTEKGNISIDLLFLTIDDFEPISIINQVPEMKVKFESRVKLNDLLAKLDGNADLNVVMDAVLAGESKTADQIVDEGKMVREEAQKAYALELVEEFLDKIAKSGEHSSSITAVSAEVGQIDLDLSEQLDEILHAPEFQKVEGTWRGLFYLVTGTDIGARVNVRLLNTTKQELSYDLEKAVGFDQSQLFKKVYEEEYGTFGGNPYSFLMSDFEFSRTQFDIELLGKISEVSAAALAPFIAGANPGLLDLDTFTNLGNIRDVATVFQSTELGKWMSFRETDESRYVALTLPHVLSRAPYGKDTNPVDGMNYEEGVDGTDNSKFSWMSSAWAMALRILEACNMHGWPVATRGVENGGLVRGLPYYTFKTTDGDVALKCPTEVAITDRREKELSDQGLIALVHCKNRDYAAFFGSQTTHKPLLYNTDEANSNSQLSARLSYIMAASRFGHYIKVMMRDRIGSFMEREDVERYLNGWLAQYILLNARPTEGMKAKYPLKAGRVDVVNVPGDPGNYKAVVFLRPHFQLEELTASLRLVADLPKPYHEQILSDLA